MDGIIDCVSAKHQLVPLLGLLKYHGKLVLVGVPPEPLDLPAAPLITGSWKYNLLIFSFEILGEISKKCSLTSFA